MELRVGNWGGIEEGSTARVGVGVEEFLDVEEAAGVVKGSCGVRLAVCSFTQAIKVVAHSRLFKFITSPVATPV